MNETWGVWFYRRPTNALNLKKALREWLGVSYSIENDAHKQLQWQQFYRDCQLENTLVSLNIYIYICIFKKRLNVFRFITIKLLTPTLSPNSHGDTFATNAVAGVDEFVERCALSALAILSGKDLTWLCEMRSICIPDHARHCRQTCWVAFEWTSERIESNAKALCSQKSV